MREDHRTDFDALSFGNVNFLHDITPVILCGGSGTRLWPLSRKSYPKQFAKPLTGRDHAVSGLGRAPLSGPGFAAPMVLTNADFRFIVTEQKSGCCRDRPGRDPDRTGRTQHRPGSAGRRAVPGTDRPRGADAGRAVRSRCARCRSAFRTARGGRGRGRARRGSSVTFGIKPSHAETGYGYLELAEIPGAFRRPPAGAETLRRKARCRLRAQAAKMLAAGTYLWNAGIFLFRADTILQAAEAHAPGMLDPVRRAVDEARADLGFLRLAPGPWSQAPADSIDYAVMEHATNLSVAPYGAGWNDLGGWTAIAREMEKDAEGNAQSGAVTAIDCENSLLRSETEGLELVGLGLRDVIAVAMDDAVLVADRARAQDVKAAVAALKAKGAKQAETFAYDHRPWGHFESLATGDRFQVKRIVVHPGAQLSLQSHMHRSEHWIVVSGTAKVTIGDEVTLVTENKSVYVPLGSKHRMENPGKVPMVLIEVQAGAYLGEDDIERYEDVYAQGPGAKG